MTTDPFGADSPFGDQPETPDVPTRKELLGLDGAEPDGAHQEPLYGADSDEALEGATDEDYLSALPGIDSDAEDPFAGITEFGELGDPGDVDEEDDSASWLMEFDLDDEDFDPDEALEEALRETQESDEPEPSGAGAWIGRGLIAVVSVALGVVGAKYLLPSGGGAPAPVEIAQDTQSNTNTGPGTPGNAATTPADTQPVAPVAGTETAADPGITKPRKDDRTGKPRVTKSDEATGTPSVAVGTNSNGGPTATTPGGPGQTPVAVETEADPGVPTIQIDWDEPGSGRMPRETTDSAPKQAQPAVEEKGGLRQASAAELAGVWTGATIPIAALRGPDRLLTPGVGRVRVVLAKGEIFEGKLYAVGQRKLWLETQLGKMALVDWQIDRIEHIVAADGTLLSGGDSSKDMAGLPNVRVRTAGGVFYGKMLSQDGSSVVLVTESGGRVTLDGAEVELAGRAATHVVDASGAENDVPVDSKTKQ